MAHGGGVIVGGQLGSTGRARSSEGDEQIVIRRPVLGHGRPSSQPGQVGWPDDLRMGAGPAVETRHGFPDDSRIVDAKEVFGGYQHSRPGPLEQVAEIFGAVAGVDADGHRAEPGPGQQQLDRQHPVGHKRRQPVASTHAPRLEPAGQPGHPALEVAERDRRSVRFHQSVSPTVGLGQGPQPLGQRGHGPGITSSRVFSTRLRTLMAAGIARIRSGRGGCHSLG